LTASPAQGVGPNFAHLAAGPLDGDRYDLLVITGTADLARLPVPGKAVLLRCLAGALTMRMVVSSVEHANGFEHHQAPVLWTSSHDAEPHQDGGTHHARAGQEACLAELGAVERRDRHQGRCHHDQRGIGE
jgi:hypothetical protein